jgi:hypothetical protein
MSIVASSNEHAQSGIPMAARSYPGSLHPSLIASHPTLTSPHTSSLIAESRLLIAVNETRLIVGNFKQMDRSFREGDFTAVRSRTPKEATKLA